MSLGLPLLGSVSLGLSPGLVQRDLAALILYPPNWATELIEATEWSTDIFESFNRVEQRRALTWVPKQTIQYQLLLVDDDVRALEHIVEGANAAIAAVPAWVDSTALTAPATSGTLFLPADTSYRRFHIEGFAVLLRSVTDYELVQITDVTPIGIEVLNPLKAPWPAGTRLLPIIRGHLDLTSTLVRRSAAVAEYEVSISAIPADVYSPVQPAPVVADGIEVFTERHNWSDNLEASIKLASEDVVYDAGLQTRLPRGRHALVGRTSATLSTSRAAAHSLRAFLARRRGRLTPCLVSSGAADFAILEDLDASSMGIAVAEIVDRRIVSALTSAYAIEIKTPSGSVVAPVAYAYAGVGRTIIALKAPLGSDIEAATVQRASIVRYSRLSADKVSFKYLTAEVLECSLTFEAIARRAGSGV